MFNMVAHSKPSHIFLTGEKKVGKSTLIDSILKSTDLVWEGIKSISVIKDDRKYVYLIDAKTPEVREENLIAICSESGVVESHPQVFDNFGTTILKKANGVELFVIDEVGFLENSAKKYMDELYKLLERTDLHVLGVIRYEESEPWYKKVVLSDNVKTFVIKEANRNNMAPVVNRLLHNIYKD